MLRPIVVPYALNQAQYIALMDDNAKPHRATIVDTTTDTQIGSVASIQPIPESTAW